MSTIDVALAGLGVTAMGKVYGRDQTDFAAEAVLLALEDAGLRKDQLDGLLVNLPGWALEGGGGVGLQRYLGIDELKLAANVNAGGATAGAMVQWAALAIASGMCRRVACVFADVPLKPSVGSREAYRFTEQSWQALQGRLSPAFDYAMAARRHMSLYGTTSEQLGAIAVATRAWACLNPRAQMRTPLTLQEHQSSRWIIEPLHLLDCCLVSNGAVAVIVTPADEAADLRQKPIHVLGMGQAHFGHRTSADAKFLDRTPAAESGAAALRMANVELRDLDVLELYDAFTSVVLMQLEDYGFCRKGEGGPFVADGKLAPGGTLPTNTGGGQLSGWYMWGFTPLAEAIVQLRGKGGSRQVEGARLALVSGSGGDPPAYHSTLILGCDVR
jgi:acetyl-CoA acetyltransferase